MKILIFDGSNVIHRANNIAIQRTVNEEELLVETVKITLQSVFKVIDEYEAGLTTFLLDLTRPDKLLHSLKGDWFDPDEVRDMTIESSKRRLMDILNASNVPCMDFYGLEADDIAYALSISDHPALADCEIVLVSSDKDWYQCINSRVTVYDPIRQIEIDEAKMIEWYGEHYRLAYVAYESMVRNKDGVTGVKGIGEVTATQLMDYLYCPDNNYARLPVDIPDTMTRQKSLIMNGFKDFMRSWDAIDYHWVVRSEVYSELLLYIDARLNAKFITDTVIRDAEIEKLGNSRMGTCINRMNDYFTRRFTYGSKETS